MEIICAGPSCCKCAHISMPVTSGELGKTSLGVVTASPHHCNPFKIVSCAGRSWKDMGRWGKAGRGRQEVFRGWGRRSMGRMMGSRRWTSMTFPTPQDTAHTPLAKLHQRWKVWALYFVNECGLLHTHTCMHMDAYMHVHTHIQV